MPSRTASCNTRGPGGVGLGGVLVLDPDPAIDFGRTIKYVYPIGAVSKMSDVD